MQNVPAGLLLRPRSTLLLWTWPAVSSLGHCPHLSPALGHTVGCKVTSGSQLSALRPLAGSQHAFHHTARQVPASLSVLPSSPGGPLGRRVSRARRREARTGNTLSCFLSKEPLATSSPSQPACCGGHLGPATLAVVIGMNLLRTPTSVRGPLLHVSKRPMKPQ